MKKTWIIAAGIAAALSIAGCEQFGINPEEIEDNVTMAEEEIADLKAAEATSSDICSATAGAPMLQGGMILQGGMMPGDAHMFFGTGFPKCATVTADSDVFPKTITIDYTDGCTGRMGLEKKGIVTIYMSDTIINEGAYYTVTIEGMTMGHREISKTATYTNDGLNDSENWVISFESLSTTSFEKDGELYTIVREFTGQMEWLEGFDTPGASDDIFYLTRNGSITVNDELRFEKTTVEPLLIDRSCRYPLSGIVEITRADETMTIDFGEGECDNIAHVTKDGVTEEIELNSGQFRKEFQRHNKDMKQNKGWW